MKEIIKKSESEKDEKKIRKSKEGKKMNEIMVVYCLNEYCYVSVASETDTVMVDIYVNVATCREEKIKDRKGEGGGEEGRRE